MVIVRTRKENRCRGAAAVEVALVLPVLLLVTFGAIRYGWFFLKLQQITNAARCGARTAILYRTVRVDELHGDVMTLISTWLGPNGAKIIEAGENIEDDEGLKVTFMINDAPSMDIGLAGPQDKITVTITVLAEDVDILPMGLFKFEPTDWKLGASITMSKEGVNT